MPKEPILYKINGKENAGELNFREQDGFLVPNKYRANPRKFVKEEYTTEKLLRIINSKQDACIVSIERSAGTNITLMKGDFARALAKKCLDSKWGFYFITPGCSFRLCNINAEPGTPVEIKFYFYQKYTPLENTPKENQKVQETDIEQILEAFKTFYVYEEVLVTSEVMQDILQNRPAFIQMDNLDLRTKIVGQFYSAPIPEEETANT